MKESAARVDVTERKVSPIDEREMMKRAHLAGAARALGLLERVPAYFKRRGWKDDEDRIAVAIAAVCCMRLGAGATRFKLPYGALDSAEWAPLGDTSSAVMDASLQRAAPVVTARQIVETLELGEMLEPPR